MTQFIKINNTIYKFKYKSHKMTQFIKMNGIVFSIFKYKNDTIYIF